MKRNYMAPVVNVVAVETSLMIATTTSIGLGDDEVIEGGDTRGQYFNWKHLEGSFKRSRTFNDEE